MFLISFATVLFTLSVWKILSFFIMPSLFFDLLFVGFPVGAFLGVKLFRVSVGSFQKTLLILQAAMFASVLLSLACKHFDYLRAHLFEVNLWKLLGQMGTFTVFFLPFFCATGLSEYVGYQLGRQHLKGRMRWVYAVYLFGAAFAYIFLNFGLRQGGITGMILLSLLLVPIASLLIAQTRTSRWILGLEAIFLLGLLFFPGREPAFLRLYKGHDWQSTWDYRVNKHGEDRFQSWGRYSLTEILYDPSVREYVGFYNDIMQWEFAPKTGFNSLMLGAVPIHTAPRGARIAIIGAGGGRQVRWAQQTNYGFEKILALELEPAVFEAVRGPLRDAFDQVYEKEGVVPIVTEARGYMERTTEQFDLIFMPSVGGYPQMMLEPGNMIRTLDAYRTLRNRLTDRGILAIWYPAGLDPKGILTSQYVRTLGEQGLGMKTQAYIYQNEYLILAAKSPGTLLPTIPEINSFLKNPNDPSGLPPEKDQRVRAMRMTVAADPGFKPITDDQPFLAGIVSNIFSLQQLHTLFAVVAGFLGIVGLALLALLRKGGDPKIPNRSFWSVAGLSLAIGANFILLEHFVVLILFKKLYVFQDALLLGSIGFLVITGLGSMLIGARLRGFAQVTAVVALVPLLLWSEQLSVAVVLALMAPVAFATGSFFPALFEQAAKNPLTVFAMDAVGAAIGSAISFFVPIAFGFSHFFPLAAAAFVLTAVMTWRFCRGLPENPAEAPAEPAVQAGRRPGRKAGGRRA